MVSWKNYLNYFVWILVDFECISLESLNLKWLFVTTQKINLTWFHQIMSSLGMKWNLEKKFHTESNQNNPYFLKPQFCVSCFYSLHRKWKLSHNAMRCFGPWICTKFLQGFRGEWIGVAYFGQQCRWVVIR